MMLSRNRIWGNIIGSNDRSGWKELKKPLKSISMSKRYQYSRLNAIFPFVSNWDLLTKRKEKYQDRKLRIFMRGMKIGQQKGIGKNMGGMSMFEMAAKGKSKDATVS